MPVLEMTQPLCNSTHHALNLLFTAAATDRLGQTATNCYDRCPMKQQLIRIRMLCLGGRIARPYVAFPHYQLIHRQAGQHESITNTHTCES
jgi:hypothetical protein